MPIDFKSWVVRKHYEEKYNRENIESILWFKKHEDEIRARAVFPDGHKERHREDIFIKQAEISMPDLTTAFNNCTRYRRKKVSIDGPILGLSSKTKDSKDKYIDPTLPIPTEKNPMPVMKPVDCDELSLLYKDKPNCSREYLKARKRKMPEEKYYFCQTTSGDYGWRLGDSTVPVVKSKYKRFCLFDAKSYSKAGVGPDPAYYQDPTNRLYFRCPQT